MDPHELMASLKPLALDSGVESCPVIYDQAVVMLNIRCIRRFLQEVLDVSDTLTIKRGVVKLSNKLLCFSSINILLIYFYLECLCDLSQ